MADKPLLDELEEHMMCSENWRGRAVVYRLPSGRIPIGSRLEVGGAVRDVHQNLSALPPGSPLVFFSNADSSPVRFHSIIFDGDGLERRNVLIDLLHTGDSGVCQYVVGRVFHVLFRHDVYETGIRHAKLKLLACLKKVQTRYSAWRRLNQRFQQGFIEDNTLKPKTLNHLA